MDTTAPLGWETLFWAAFTRSWNPMSLLDRDRMRVAVNPALCNYLQRSRSELVGRRGDEVLTESRRAAAEAAWEGRLKAGQWTGETDAVRGDGTVIHCHYQARVASIGGRSLVLIVLLAGERAIGPADNMPAELSPRERTVLHLLTLGLGSAEIAERMSISIETVRTHVRNAMRKTGAKTRAQLVAETLLDRSSQGE